MKVLLLFLLLPLVVWAQPFEFVQEWDSIPVEIEGYQIPVPWTGGYNYTSPDLCDIDGDSDFDFFLGSNNGNLEYYENAGTLYQEAFIISDLLFIETDDFDRCYPEFWDMDGDEDYDLFLYSSETGIRVYENIGNAHSPELELINITLTDTLGNEIFGTEHDLVDIDGDSDKDLFVGCYSANALRFYKNVGSSSIYAFVCEDSCYFGIQISNWTSPTFCDIDDDGDFDLFIGQHNGDIAFYRNSGSPEVADFLLVSTEWLDIGTVHDLSLEFCDIDSDGDYDLFVGVENNITTVHHGAVNFWKNIGTPQEPNFIEDQQMYLTLDFGDEIAHRICDLDFDGDGDLFFYDPDLGCFENIGNPDSVYLQLGSWAFGGELSTHDQFDFGDLDGDGDYDLIKEGSGDDYDLYFNTGGIEHPWFEWIYEMEIGSWSTGLTMGI
jgi:hypothetical protein